MSKWDEFVVTKQAALMAILHAIIVMAGMSAQFAGTASSTGSARLADSRKPMPRHLYRSVMALMRPLELAIRRLIVIAARNVKVPPVAPKPPPPPINPSVVPAGSNRTGIVLVPIRSWGIAALNQPAKPKRERKPLARYTIPVCDPVWRFGRKRRRRVPEHLAPRITYFNGNDPPRPVAPPTPTRDDPMNATRLVLRLEAYGRALTDIQREARRMARWMERRKAGYKRRSSPIRPGPAWALRGKRSRRPKHEIDEHLRELHATAKWSMDPASRTAPWTWRDDLS